MAQSLTPDDIRILEKTRSVREKLLDSYVAANLVSEPSSKDVYALVALTDSLDSNVIQQAKIRVEEQNNQIEAETKHVLTELIKNLHSGKPTEGFENLKEVHEVPEFQPTGLEISEGELIRKTDEVDASILDEL